MLLFRRHQGVQRDEFVVLTCDFEKAEDPQKLTESSRVRKTVTQTFTHHIERERDVCVYIYIYIHSKFIHASSSFF